MPRRLRDVKFTLTVCQPATDGIDDLENQIRDALDTVVPDASLDYAGSEEYDEKEDADEPA